MDPHTECDQHMTYSTDIIAMIKLWMGGQTDVLTDSVLTVRRPQIQDS